MSKAAPKTVHQLKITLRSVKPPVWRRVVVRSDVKLSELAPLLESTMGWYGGHLHQFEAAGKRYGEPDPDWGAVRDERGRKLATVLPEVGSSMRFDYDFGDGWEHDVVVEAIEPAERGVRYPRLLAGKRACLPEDCGGPWGYQNLLEALADPKHPDHGDLTEWVGGEFDPEHFDAPRSSSAWSSTGWT
jgi:hypothetical protein